MRRMSTRTQEGFCRDEGISWTSCGIEILVLCVGSTLLSIEQVTGAVMEHIVT